MAVVWKFPRRPAGRLSKTHTHMAMMAAVFAAIGLTLWLQPGRYSNTPAYANLLDIARQQTWAVVYLVAAALKVATICRRGRTLFVIAHTVTITLVSVWLAAFVVRYLTDPGTTIVNVCSWSTYLYLVVRSAQQLDDQPPASLSLPDPPPLNQDNLR